MILIEILLISVNHRVELPHTRVVVVIVIVIWERD